MEKFRITLPALALVLLLVTAGLYGLAGCSDDDHPTVTPQGRISSPDDLVAAFTQAIEDMDIEAMAPLLDQYSGRFHFLFRDEDVAKLSLPTDFLDRGDMIRAWRNVFAGERIFNHAGQWLPGVTSIEVTRCERNTDWQEPNCWTGTWWDMRLNLKKVNFRIEMTITQVGDLPPLFIEGNLEVRVRPPQPGASLQCGSVRFAFFNMVDGSWEPRAENQVTLGGFLYSYFTNAVPVVDLSVEQDIDGDPLRVEASACSSTDSGETALSLAYRWRTSPDGIWTAGSEECVRRFDVPGSGSWYLEVEARDRWGLYDRKNLTLTWFY